MSLPEKQKLESSTAPVDRRLYPRYNIKVQIELRPEGSDVPMRLETTDLSRNGCYIVTNMPLPVATKVQVSLWLGEDRVRLRGCVVTRHPQFGNGIMFLKFDADGEPKLKAFLDKIRLD